MGFISYHGKKEDRYDMVLEYSRFQQKLEKEQLQEALVAVWMKQVLGEEKYADLSINEIIKYIMIKYRRLRDIKELFLEEYGSNSEKNIDSTRLWNDFSIYLITRHLEPFHFEKEKKMHFYTIFASKVFKLNDFPSAEQHFENMSKSTYRNYFSSCFDVAGEKHFWKWIGKIGQGAFAKQEEFIVIYEQLIVLMGQYLFLGFHPESDEWIRQIDIEKRALERIKEAYRAKKLKEPDYKKLINPLVSCLGESNRAYTNSRLDKTRFSLLLEKQNLDSFAEACKLLILCNLPDEMDRIYKELIKRLYVLEESIDKYKEVYEPEMFVFYDYYIPEALELTALFVEYLEAGIKETILKENEQEVIEAITKLLLAIDEKIDEIYKFASIQLKAKAKALDSLLSQDGYVEQRYKMD